MVYMSMGIWIPKLVSYGYSAKDCTWSSLGLKEVGNALALEGLAALRALKAGLAHGWRHWVPLQFLIIVWLADLCKFPAHSRVLSAHASDIARICCLPSTEVHAQGFC